MTKVKVAIIKILQETNVKTCLKHGKIKVLGKKKIGNVKMDQMKILELKNKITKIKTQWRDSTAEQKNQREELMNDKI